MELLLDSIGKRRKRKLNQLIQRRAGLIFRQPTGTCMLWPIVLVLVFLWLLGLLLDISGVYSLLIIAAVLTVSNFLISRKHPV